MDSNAQTVRASGADMPGNVDGSAVVTAGLPTPSPRSAPGDRGAPAFVWGVWALTLATTLAFVLRHGHNIPYVDEFLEMIPAVAGELPVTPGWLWSQHAGGEHRLPLPRLMYVTLTRLAGIDLRAVMFFNVMALGALAFAVIRCARTVRGQTAYADAFFPLVVVGLGHYHNLMWGFQIQFILSTTLAGTLLLLIIRTGHSPLTLGRAVLAGTCLVLLPLCGVNGVLFVPPLALWAGYASIHWYAARPHGKRNTLVLLGLTCAALLLAGFYFIGYEASRPGRVDGLTSLLIAWQFLTTGLGLPKDPLGLELWPYSGIVVAAVLLLTVGFLGLVLWRNPSPERARALGLLLFLASVFGLAAGVGWGRAGADPYYGLTDRYVTVSVLALCCACFVWIIYGSPTASRFAQTCLFAVMCCTSSLTIYQVLKSERESHQVKISFERDLLAGVPRLKLAQMYAGQLSGGTSFDAILVADRLRMLREGGAEPYRQMREGPLPPYLAAALDMKPTAVFGMTWEDSAGRITGSDSLLEFALSETTFVCALDIHFSYSDIEGDSTVIQVQWRTKDQRAWRMDQRYACIFETALGDKRAVVWVYDEIDEFSINPSDKPCEFRISEILLHLPKDRRK